MEILIFGAGCNGRRLLNHIKNNGNVIVNAFIDNKKSIIGSNIDGVEIIQPNEIKYAKFDKIIIALASVPQIADTLTSLRENGIPLQKVEIYLGPSYARREWLNNFSHNYVYGNNLTGSVAECGVNQGAFARSINECFPDRLLYLFDTFDGFTDNDLAAELSLGDEFDESRIATAKSLFKDSSVERVMEIMPKPHMCIVKKGVFPDTTAGIEDSFIFVNIDMDLYRPTLAALHWFWGRMLPGGVILVHDYYHEDWPGVAQAVGEFEHSIKRRLCKIPIGDFLSIAIIKN